jgi:hypothetical protein
MPKKTQDSESLLAVVQTPPDAPDEEVTNINATAFCPFINHKKRDYMPRYCPTGKSSPNDRYHYWQTKDYKLIQFCRLQRNPQINPEICEKFFKKCDTYLDEVNK